MMPLFGINIEPIVIAVSHFYFAVFIGLFLMGAVTLPDSLREFEKTSPIQGWLVTVVGIGSLLFVSAMWPAVAILAAGEAIDNFLDRRRKRDPS